MKSVAVYSGTFDPVTNGHMDIIERASKLYDTLYVVVFNHPSKQCLFTTNERITLLKSSLKHLPNVVVDSSDELVVDYAKKTGAHVIIRGLRNSQDFSYEKQMALTNRYLDDSIETVFLLSKEINMTISSSQVKEIASFHHDVKGLVPDEVRTALMHKMEK